MFLVFRFLCVDLFKFLILTLILVIYSQVALASLLAEFLQPEPLNLNLTLALLLKLLHKLELLILIRLTFGLISPFL